MRHFIGGSLLLISLAGGCARQDNSEDPLATSRQELTASELGRIFSFEGTIGNSGDWVPTSGTAVSAADQKSDGSKSMAVSGAPEVSVVSTALSAIGTVGPSVGLDIRLPSALAGTYYFGHIQAFFNSNTLGLYNQNSDDVQLTSLTPGQFSRISIPISSAIAQKLSQPGYSDLKITLKIGLANTTSKTYIDKLAFAAAGSGGTGGTSSGGSSNRGGSGGTLVANSTGGAGVGGAGVGVGIAVGKPATASSALLPNNPVSYGNDSAANTDWCASAATLPATWRVNLGGSYDITGTSITWPAAASGYGYIIQASPDDIAYSNVVDRQVNSSSAQIQSDSFTFRAQYVGVQITRLPASVTRACMRDFQVYGTAVAPSSGGGGASSTGSGGAMATGGLSSSGGNASGSTTSTSTVGGTSGSGGSSSGGSSIATTPITFSFQLPKGVDRSRVAVSTTSGELWLNDRAKVQSPAGNGHYASIAAVANGRVTRIGTNAEVQDVWSDGNVTLANSAIVHGDLSTRGAIDGQAGYLIQGKTIYNAPINPTEIVSWTVQFPQMTASETILSPTSGTTRPSPGAYPGFVVNRAAHLKLTAGTYYINTLTTESDSFLEIDNSAGPVIVYVRNNLTLRGIQTRSIDQGGFLVAYAGNNTVALEAPFRGILVAPNASVILATMQSPFVGAFYAKAITVHQANLVTHEPWTHDTLCSPDAACSALCPCGSDDQATCTGKSDCQSGMDCSAYGRCSCIPQCTGKQCGGDLADGCGATCPMVCKDGEIGCVPGRADCAEGSICFAGKGPVKGFPSGTNICLPAICQEADPSHVNCGSASAACGTCSACVPDCAGRSCGPDGCGGNCGTASAEQICLGGKLVNAYDPAADHTAEFPTAIPTNFATVNGEAGAIPANFKVTDRGMASYTIPLQLPPGRHGLVPNLSLTYESTRSTGMVGLGWAIGGFSKIERCNRTIAVHGKPAPISLTADDAFCLDGVVLVDALTPEGPGLKPAHTHDTELERFQVIRASGTEYVDGYYVGPASFRVWTKDGYILTYGAVDEYNLLAIGSASTREDAVVNTKGVHRAWHLSQIEDHAGNFASFVYQRTTELWYQRSDAQGYETTTEILPMRALYGQKHDPISPGSNPYFGPTAAVEFTYIDNPKATHHYVAGYLTYQTKILSRIDTYTQTLAGLSANPVMTYKLDYTAPDDLGPRLQSLTQCSRGPSASGTTTERCLPPTKMEYTEFKGYERHNLDTFVNLDYCIASDVEGNGQQQALCSEWKVWYDNIAKQLKMEEPGALESGGVSTGRLAMDVNRDGHDDLVAGCEKAIYLTKRDLSGAWSSQKTDLYLQTDPNYSTNFCSNRSLRRGDVDGDGLDDVVILREDSNIDGITWKRQEKYGLGPQTWLVRRTADFYAYKWSELRFFDKESDGRLDMFVVDPVSNEAHDINETNDIWNGSTKTVATLDINGDGLLDILEYSLDYNLPAGTKVDGDGTYFILRVNTGRGFIAKGVVTPWICWSPEQRAMVIDIDHDGRDDVYFGGVGSESPCPQGILRATRGGTLKWKAFGTTSDPFVGTDYKRKAIDLNGDGVLDVMSQDAVWISNSTSPGLLSKVTNGRGERISVEYNQTVDWPKNDGTIATTQLPVYSAGINSPPLDSARDLRRVTPLVSTYRVDQAVYSSGIVIVPGEYHRFHYENARMGLNGRGLYGFREKWEAQIDPNGKLVTDTRTTFHNDEYWRAGLVAETRVTSGLLPGGYSRVVTTTNEWQHLLSTGSGRVFPWLRRQITKESEVEEIRRVEREWMPDEYGNAALASTVTFVAGEERARTSFGTSYHVDVNRWLTALPELVTTTDAHGDDVEYRQLRYSYTDDGLVATVTREPNRPEMRIKTTYERDPVSRNVETIIEAGAGSQLRVSRIVYDSRDQFPIGHENAEGETTEVQHDSRTGQILTSKDPNGVVTQWGYDPFGRVELVKTPTQQLERAYRHIESDVGTAASGGVWAAEMQYERLSPKGRSTTRYLDGYGRLVASNTTGLAAESVHEEFTRDWAGRVVRQTVPHAFASKSQGVNQYPRDILGRVTASIAPDGRVTQYEYYNLGNAMATGLFWDNAIYATLRLDPNGLATYDYADERNQPVKAIQYDPSSGASPSAAVAAGLAAVSSYELGAFGLARSVTDPDGEVTTLQLDAWGRRLQIAADSTGQTQNSYSGFDELIEEIDANGDKTCFSYDKLSRPIATRRPNAAGGCDGTGELVASWQYGVNLGEIGKLVSTYRQAAVGTTIGTIETYRYETEVPGAAYAGRLKSVERSVPGLSDAMTTSYDYDGPYLSTVHYPSAAGSAFAVHYERDVVGNIISVKDASGGDTPATEYWKYLSHDEGQRIASETMGDGVSTSYGYMNLNAGCAGSAACMPGALRMIRVAPTSNPSNSLQHLEYRYDAGGYLNHIEHYEHSASVGFEDFTNDVFGRLKGHEDRQDGNWYSTSYQYSLGGDIQSVVRANLGGSRTDSYGYNAASPKLVQSFGTTNYTYDLKGRRIARSSTSPTNPNQAIAYNDLDLPETVTNGGTDLHRFEYDGMGGRSVVRASDATTIYAGEHYRCTGATQTGTRNVSCDEHHFGVFLGDRLLAEVTKDSFGNIAKQRYIHGDHLGSASLITDETGMVVENRKFDPFGAPKNAFVDGDLRSGFTGHEHDSALGLIYMRGRMYDPALRRFITPDPFVTEPWNTQGMNRFAYVQNSPLNYVDPSGFDGEQNRSGGGGAEVTFGPEVICSTVTITPNNNVTTGASPSTPPSTGAGMSYPESSGTNQSRETALIRGEGGGQAAPQGPGSGAMMTMAAPMSSSGSTVQSGGATQASSGPGTDVGNSTQRSGDGRGQGGAGNTAQGKGALPGAQGQSGSGKAAPQCNGDCEYLGNLFLAGVPVPVGGVLKVVGPAARGAATLLARLGIDKAAFTAGSMVAFEQPGLVGFAQMQGSRLVAGVFSINAPGRGVAILSQFRAQAVMLARAVGATEVELVGAEFTNSALRAMLARQGFVAGTMEAPTALGGGTMNVLSKVIGL